MAPEAFRPEGSRLTANQLLYSVDLKYDLAREVLFAVSGSIEMCCRACIAVLAVFPVPGAWTGSIAVAAGLGGAEEKKQPTKSAARPAGTSLTGCVDEQDGRFVLVNDRTLSPIADLAAEGFPQEGFAKHLGHKVTVRGTSIPRGTRPLFRVRSVAAVSDVCAPESPQTGK
jgi:hypothetical protein